MDPFSAIAGPWYSYLADAEDSISVIAPLLAVSKDMAASIRENLRGKVTLHITRDIPVSWFKRNGSLLGDVRSYEKLKYSWRETAKDAGPRIWHVLGHLTATTKLIAFSFPRHLSALEQLPTGLVELDSSVGDNEYWPCKATGACDLRHLTRLTSLDFRFRCCKAQEATRLPTSLEKLGITTGSANLAGMLRELPNLRELQMSYFNANSTSDVEMAEVFSSMTALTAVTMLYERSTEYGSDRYGGFAALLSALGTRLVSLIRANGGWDVEQCAALAGATNMTQLDLPVIYDGQIEDLDALQRALLQLPKLERLHMDVWSVESRHSVEQLTAFAAVVKAAVPKADITVPDNRDPSSTSSSDPDSESDFE